MTRLHWVRTLGAVAPTPDTAWIWLVDTQGDIAAAALRLARATRGDLQDAAIARDPRRGGARLIRRRLLRALAARVLDRPASDVEIEREPSGRCVVREPRRMFASIARYKSWAALAIASVPIGVDLEDAHPQPHLPVDILPRRVAIRMDMAVDHVVGRRVGHDGEAGDGQPALAHRAGERGERRITADVQQLGGVRVQIHRRSVRDEAARIGLGFRRGQAEQGGRRPQ